MCAAAFLGNNNSWEGKMWSWLSDPSLTGMINIMTIMKTLRLLYLSLHGKLEDGMGFSLVISTSGNRTNNSGSIWVRGFVPNPRYQGHSEQTVRGSEVIFFASLSKGYTWIFFQDIGYKIYQSRNKYERSQTRCQVGSR